MKQASLIAGFVAYLTATAAVYADEAARRYAVLSLIGDSMTVVVYVIETGSHMDRHRHESVSPGPNLLDRAALNAVQQSLKQIDARSPVLLFLGTSPELFGDPSQLFDGKRLLLSQDLSEAMRKGGATHLLLVTRHRDGARIQASNGTVGSGKLEGLGFYIDPYTRTSQAPGGGLGVMGTGFLAPYVYLRILLVDLTTSMVDREELITWSILLSAASGATDDPRAVLAGAQLKFLVDALTREIHRVVPSLVGNSSSPLSPSKAGSATDM